DEQHRPAILRVEHVLFFREPLGAAREQVGCLALAQAETAGVSWIEVLQAETLALGNSKWRDVFLDAVENLLSRHGSLPSWRRDLIPTAPIIDGDGSGSKAVWYNARGSRYEWSTIPAPEVNALPASP